jgi:hypothetical protein
MTRIRFSYNDVNLSWETKLENYHDYRDLSLIHARHAKELMVSIEFDPKCIPTITDPALTEALIHAQLSTTYAILHEAKK